MTLNKTSILITGASSGLGRAIAIACAQKGAKLTLCARNSAGLKSLKQAIEADYHTSVTIKTTDVTDQTQVKASILHAIRTYGTLDIIVANAGITHKAPLWEFTDDEYNQIMSTNTQSVFWYLNYGYEHMKSGQIVVISSLASWLFFTYYSLYAASKAATDKLVAGFNKDSQKPIKAISLHPGRLRTAFSQSVRYPSSTRSQIDPRHYAQYVIARIENNTLMSVVLFIRNLFLHIVSLK